MLFEIIPIQIAALSFRLDEDEEEEDQEEEEEEEEYRPTIGSTDKHKLSESENSMDGQEPHLKKKKITKNPDVDTSFLPDREREEEERRLREELRQVKYVFCNTLNISTCLISVIEHFSCIKSLYFMLIRCSY